MLNHNVFRPFLCLSTVVISLQTLVTVGSTFPCMHVKPDGVVRQMKHDLVVFREVIVIELYQNPYRSKEMEDPWKQIAVKLSVLDHPKFKVNKRFVRDRQTLLLPSLKQKCAKRKMPLQSLTRRPS